MFGSTCSTDGCENKATDLFSGRCHFHDALRSARELSPEEFDRLRNALATTPPLSDEERRARQVRSSLRAVTWQARDLSRSKKRARKAGATEGQIADAVRSGKVEARR